MINQNQRDTFRKALSSLNNYTVKIEAELDIGDMLTDEQIVVTAETVENFFTAQGRKLNRKGERLLLVALFLLQKRDLVWQRGLFFLQPIEFLGGHPVCRFEYFVDGARNQTNLSSGDDQAVRRGCAVQ